PRLRTRKQTPPDPAVGGGARRASARPWSHEERGVPARAAPASLVRIPVPSPFRHSVIASTLPTSGQGSPPPRRPAVGGTTLAQRPRRRWSWRFDSIAAAARTGRPRTAGTSGRSTGPDGRLATSG